MSWGRALVYFLHEAALSLVRSFRASGIAVLTIALSLYVGGFFFLVTRNLSGLVEDWRSQLRVVVYLESGASEQAIRELEELLATPPFVESVESVSPEQALERFGRSFPSLKDVVSDLDGSPFPASLEASLAESVEPAGLSDWLSEIESSPATEQVDDDREWLTRLSRLLAIARGIGLMVGTGLLVASALTIASVVKLTAYLYVEEIAVMRLVGATEFFIRGPFYAEGLLQGLAGGFLALGGLFATSRALLASVGDSVYLNLLLDRSLTWGSMAVLVLIGGLAGLLGAVFALRREALVAASE